MQFVPLRGYAHEQKEQIETNRVGSW